MRTDEEREDEELIVDSGEDAEQQEAELQDDGQADEAAEQQDEDDLVIGFGDEVESDEEQGAPDWVKDVRKRNRELAAEIARLKSEKGDNHEQPVLGPKPKLVEFDYDEDAFDKALDQWHEHKRQIEAAENEAQRKQRESKEAWQRELQDFEQKKAKLARPDYDDVELRVADTLNQVQQAIIVKGGKHFDPAAMIYALGKSPSKLEQLAKISDPLDFAFTVASMSKELKVIQRKKGVEPETRVKGSAPLSSGKDIHLEKLEREADRTGDRSKVIAYKRQQRAKQTS
jgi:hypothetical protein